MDLILVRHGEAETAGPMQTDAERRLTPVGERAAARTGRMLADLGLVRPRVIASPKVRAFETARIIARELSADPPTAIPILRGDGDAGQILAALAEEKADCVIAVGHMPDLGKLAARLLDPGVSGAVAIPTAGYVWLELDGLPPHGAARLRRFE